MESSLNLRVSLLEEKNMWTQSTLVKMDQKIDRLEEGQLRLVERISGLQAHTDARFIEIAREFNGVHRELALVHDKIAGVHEKLTGLHESIAHQTRWILSVILFASVIAPVVLKLLDRYL